MSGEAFSPHRPQAADPSQRLTKSLQAATLVKCMRAVKRRRPLRRERVDWNADDLKLLAPRVRYTGSPERKRYPSSAGRPAARLDATLCDPRRHGDFDEITEWLQTAILDGAVGGPRTGAFPEHVWCRCESVVHEARLSNSELGEYQGYPPTAREAELLTWL